MLPLTDEQIKEIAEMLDSGEKCFWNIKTNEIILIPDPDDLHFEEEFWVEDLATIEENEDDIRTIEKRDSSEYFEMMTDFADNLKDKNIQQKLYLALNARKPFRGFRDILDESIYLQDWYNYKEEAVLAWTKEDILEIVQVESRKETDEDN